jgi:hypothetical protein
MKNKVKGKWLGGISQVTDQAPGPEFKKRKRKRNSNSKLTDCV